MPRSADAVRKARPGLDALALRGEGQLVLHGARDVRDDDGDGNRSHTGGEIAVDQSAADVAALTTCEVGLGSNATISDRHVEIAGQIGPAGVNGGCLQHESSFGFAVRMDLR